MVNTVLVVVLLLVGIILIVKGGDFFVDAATWIATVSGIPNFIIGATIVSIATTLPELLVSLMAAAKGSVDMAAGNAVGSVTANVALIMGISLVCLPGIAKRSQIAFKAILMIVSIVILCLFSQNGGLSIIESVIILVFFVCFIIENIITAKKQISSDSKPETKPGAKEIAVNIVKFVVGAVGIVIGADLLVDNGTILAQVLGVPDGIIGVTLVAVGTSLPELVTTLTAISKKQASLSVGNIIGANVIDLTIILPLCAVVSGKELPVTSRMATLDMTVCLIVCLIAVVPALISEKFRRWQGVVLLAGYIGYLVILIGFNGFGL